MNSKKTILIVDDSENVARLIQLNLDFEGYETRVAHDGRDALALVHEEIPDLLILDILMPRLDGWGVLREIRGDPTTRDIPVIMLTALTKEEDLRRGWEAGVFDYITKPFNPMRLVETVKRCLTKSSRLPGVDLPAATTPVSGEAIRVAIVGVDGSGIHILQTLLGNSKVRVQGVYDPDAESPGLSLARGMKLFTTTSFEELLDIGELDLIIETRPHILNKSLLERGRTGPCEVLSGFSARFVWGLLEEKEGSEERVKGLLGELREKQQLVEQLLARVISAQEEERKKIALEIHDSIAQTLVSALTEVETLKGFLKDHSHRVGTELITLSGLLTRSVKELREIMFALRPASLDDLGLTAAVENFAKRFSDENRIEVEVKISKKKARLAPLIETTLFRLVQEALANVKKHASARRVEVRMEFYARTLELRIKDDGKGFDVDRVIGSYLHSDSYGLSGMRERAGFLGGTFQVTSSERGGTEVFVTIPLE
ncbi:MAG: response regulator [Armatimonadetes bacterium]|nr:response regulator [Armatimonadota bacterium]